MQCSRAPSLCGPRPLIRKGKPIAKVHSNLTPRHISGVRGSIKNSKSQSHLAYEEALKQRSDMNGTKKKFPRFYSKSWRILHYEEDRIQTITKINCKKKKEKEKKARRQRWKLQLKLCRPWTRKASTTSNNKVIRIFLFNPGTSSQTFGSQASQMILKTSQQLP